MWIEIDDILYVAKSVRVFNYSGCPSPYVIIDGDEWFAEIRNSQLTVNEIKEYITDAIIRRIPILSFSKDEGWDVGIVRPNIE